MPRDGHAQAAVADQRQHSDETGIFGDGFEIILSAFPTPIPRAHQNGLRIVVQLLAPGAARVGRETAVAHHLRGYALIGFLAAVGQHLNIGVAVYVDEARRQRQTRAVDAPAVRGWL